MIGIPRRSSVRTAGDGKGATRAWQYYDPRGLGGALARFSPSAQTIRQAERPNFRLITTFPGSTLIGRSANGVSRIKEWSTPMQTLVIALISGILVALAPVSANAQPGNDTTRTERAEPPQAAELWKKWIRVRQKIPPINEAIEGNRDQRDAFMEGHRVRTDPLRRELNKVRDLLDVARTPEERASLEKKEDNLIEQLDQMEAERFAADLAFLRPYNKLHDRKKFIFMEELAVLLDIRGGAPFDTIFGSVWEDPTVTEKLYQAFSYPTNFEISMIKKTNPEMLPPEFHPFDLTTDLMRPVLDGSELVGWLTTERNQAVRFDRHGIELWRESEPDKLLDLQPTLLAEDQWSDARFVVAFKGTKTQGMWIDVVASYAPKDKALAATHKALEKYHKSASNHNKVLIKDASLVREMVGKILDALKTRGANVSDQGPVQPKIERLRIFGHGSPNLVVLSPLSYTVDELLSKEGKTELSGSDLLRAITLVDVKKLRTDSKGKQRVVVVGREISPGLSLSRLRGKFTDNAWIELHSCRVVGSEGPRFLQELAKLLKVKVMGGYEKQVPGGGLEGKVIVALPDGKIRKPQ